MAVLIPFYLALTILTLGRGPAQGGVLESPGDGNNLSGLGFISGWKCNAGRITVTLNGGGHIPVATGQPRAEPLTPSGAGRIEQAVVPGPYYVVVSGQDPSRTDLYRFSARFTR